MHLIGLCKFLKSTQKSWTIITQPHSLVWVCVAHETTSCSFAGSKSESWLPFIGRQVSTNKRHGSSRALERLALLLLCCYRRTAWLNSSTSSKTRLAWLSLPKLCRRPSKDGQATACHHYPCLYRRLQVSSHRQILSSARLNQIAAVISVTEDARRWKPMEVWQLLL